MAKTTRARSTKSDEAEAQREMDDGSHEAENQQAVVFTHLIVALDDLSSKQLTEIIEKASAIRDERLEGERTEFLDRVRAEAAQLGISLDRIAPPPPSTPRRGKSQAPVKFKGPNENDTWTGRGRLPNWLAALEAEGRSRDEFLIDKPGE